MDETILNNVTFDRVLEVDRDYRHQITAFSLTNNGGIAFTANGVIYFNSAANRTRRIRIPQKFKNVNALHYLAGPSLM